VAESVAVKKLLSWMIFAVVAIYGGVFVFHHFPATTKVQSAEAAESQAAPAPATQSTDPVDAAKAVTVVGPLADYMQDPKPSAKDEKPLPTGPPNAKDLIGDSAVGTGGAILHKTFPVATTVKFVFEIPAHVTNPQLHGTYRSFLKQAGDAPADGNSNVEFLLMSMEQYADFARGHQADVLYFVESSHGQQVSFGLSPTFDKPAQYCLVFRNRSTDVGKKFVQADFSVDF